MQKAEKPKPSVADSQVPLAPQAANAPETTDEQVRETDVDKQPQVQETDPGSIPVPQDGPASGAPLWLVDRSRVQLGRVGCPRARYREYHSGPTGYGIRRTAQSLPLVTGSQVHGVLETLLRRLNAGPVEEVREIIQGACGAYRRRCAARGYLELLGADPATQAETLRVIDEQAALIEAMGWALHLYWLPALLSEWEPVIIEQEMLVALDAETTLMAKPDAIMRRRADGAYAQFEAKTVGGYKDTPFWRKQWQDSIQLMLSKIAAESCLRQPVSFAYLFAMDKGKRQEEKGSGLFKQFTPFLYAYHRPANPPFEEEDWQLYYSYVGDDGRNHTVSKKHQRTATWTYDFPDKPSAEISNIEWWVRNYMRPEDVMAQHEVMGPFSFLDHSEESVLRSLRADERRWRAGLFRVYGVGEACDWDESDPRFVEALDEAFPQSWNCHAYGKDCQFLPICRREPLWAAPHEDERYELRRPHHQPEIEQMVARGIEPPADQDEEGEEA